MTIAIIYIVGAILAALVLHRLRKRPEHLSWFTSPKVEFIMWVICWPFGLIMAVLYAFDKAVGFVHDKAMAYFSKDDDSDVSQ